MIGEVIGQNGDGHTPEMLGILNTRRKKQSYLLSMGTGGGGLRQIRSIPIKENEGSK